MTATVTHIDTARQRRTQTNVVPLRPIVRIDHIAERIARHRAAMNRMMQDHNLGWLHTCQHVGATDFVPHGEHCIWCGAADPNSPDDAA